MSEEIDTLAKVIWEYHQLKQTVSPADVIIVLGSNDPRVADRGAELFLDGYAQLIVVSGYKGKLTKEWQTSEAQVFYERLLSAGVPSENIIRESRSTNTGENIQFSRQMLEVKGMTPQKVITVQKPYMERRAYATFKKVWPEPDLIVTSPTISYENYFTDYLPKEKVIALMVGDLQRIKIYPEKGFQIPQEIPSDVWAAYEKLVKMGYTSHLIDT